MRHSSGIGDAVGITESHFADKTEHIAYYKF